MKEYLKGPYGEKNYANNADARMKEIGQSIINIEREIGGYLSSSEQKMLENSKGLFLSMMFNDQDVLAKSKNYKGKKRIVRFPMLLAYLETRERMLRVLLGEIERYQVQSRSWKKSF